MALKKRFLGELLIEAGVITSEQRDKAMQEQKRIGKRLGETLVSLGYLTEDVIAKALSKQLGMPFKELKLLSIAPEVIAKIPESAARKYRLLPIEINKGKLVIAMADPLDVFAVDEIIRITKMSVDTVISEETELMRTLDKYYRGGEMIDEVVRAADTFSPEREKILTSASDSSVEDTPIVKLVTTIISQAIKDRASDVHIEPYAESLRVRFRIDGKLHDIMKPPKHLHAGMLSRIKILSGMDIAEKRIPQDGRFPMNIDNRQFDLRASTLPTLYGEKMVLRLLEKTSGLPQLKLGDLGFSEDTLRAYEKLISKPYGFVLSTGPTGSGKTTTMYASLRNISASEQNIITIEDPIEYNLPDINQVQINPKAGLTFASGLRSILRQDPDIIMIGEIRDVETASIATHAALTGHLVLSTLHTNESVGAIARLIDMGVEPFLITSSLIGVLGQRLVVKICPYCKESYTTELDILKTIGIKGKTLLYRGKGCRECRSTGYLGRDGLYELLSISESIKKLIIEKATASEIKAQAVKEGFRTMRQEGLLKVAAGITTLEEVLRVTEEED
ncbi:MAG: Flp pilus assembly complex ATPase component TadA [Nitrospiraceae bacterium]|nr:Flp pilus assembly complex ATPase component TadA [Nitrospiraceae bacterium]